MKRNKKMHQSFLFFLKQRGCRPDTIKQYAQRLRMLKSDVTQFTKEHVEEYLYKKSESGCLASTINNYIKVIKVYGESQNLQWTQGIKYWHEDEPNREALSDQEIERLLSLECPKDFKRSKWDRWTLFLELMAYTGMRPNEVASIREDQIDKISRVISLPKTKTVPRKVPIPQNIKLPEFRSYLFPAVNNSERPHVWRSAWQKHFDKRKELAGITRKGISIYSFRHSFITNLVEEDVNILAIGNAVGHSDPASTKKYTHLGVKSAQRAQNRHRLIRKHLGSQERFKQLIDDIKKSGILDANGIEYSITNDTITIKVKGKQENNYSLAVAA